jgi:TonB family protein
MQTMKTKSLAIVLLFMTSITTNAQDTIWISKKGNIVSSKDSIQRYDIIYKNAADTQQVRVVSFWPDGTISGEANYFPYTLKPVLHGISRRYNYGRLADERMYANGQLNGYHNTFWENGKQRRKDLYENGKFISGNCYGYNDGDTAWFDYEQPASFPGGMDSLRRFVQRHFIYPPLAKAQEIQGIVKVQFIITKDGSLADIAVINSVNSTLANAAIQLVKKMPNWIPAAQDGRLVKMRFILPVTFRLSE